MMKDLLGHFTKNFCAPKFVNPPWHFLRFYILCVLLVVLKLGLDSTSGEISRSHKFMHVVQY